jgi:hypothetical protein
VTVARLSSAWSEAGLPVRGKVGGRVVGGAVGLGGAPESSLEF